MRLLILVFSSYANARFDCSAIEYLLCHPYINIQRRIIFNDKEIEIKINKLLAEGDLFETKPGRIKILE